MRSVERVAELERKGLRTGWDSKTRGARGTTWYFISQLRPREDC